jgi:hypothetical protein
VRKRTACRSGMTRSWDESERTSSACWALGAGGGEGVKRKARREGREGEGQDWRCGPSSAPRLRRPTPQPLWGKREGHRLAANKGWRGQRGEGAYGREVGVAGARSRGRGSWAQGWGRAAHPAFADQPHNRRVQRSQNLPPAHATLRLPFVFVRKHHPRRVHIHSVRRRRHRPMYSRSPAGASRKRLRRGGEVAGPPGREPEIG